MMNEKQFANKGTKVVYTLHSTTLKENQWSFAVYPNAMKSVSLLHSMLAALVS